MMIALPVCFMFAGCSEMEPNSIVSIEKTDTVGLVDTYTITYTDGTTSTFSITNGKDGVDGDNGKDVTIDEIYEKYKEEYGDISYQEFLNLYLTVNNDLQEKVVNSNLFSVMRVYSEFCVTKNVSGFFGNTTETKTEIASGSAVIYKVEADYTYVITNYHVVYNSNANSDNGSTKIAKNIAGYLYGTYEGPKSNGADGDYTIYEYGKSALMMEYIGGSITKDIAVLRIPTETIRAQNANVKGVDFAESYNLGEEVFAIGNPLAEGISVTSGIISVLNEQVALSIDNQVRYYNSIRTDTSIYEGSSGGALFNKSGELVGITNSGDEEEHINFAIPMEIVESSVLDIIQNYYDNDADTFGVDRVKLGFTLTTTNSSYVLNPNTGLGRVVETLVVSEIIADSIFDDLGFVDDDVLTGFYINGEYFSINLNSDCDYLFALPRIGDLIAFEYSRSGVSYDSASHQVVKADLVTVE